MSNNPENLEKLHSEYPSIKVVHQDLSEWDQTREAVESLGVFDGLVNSSGVAIIEPFFDVSPTSFDK